LCGGWGHHCLINRPQASNKYIFFQFFDGRKIYFGFSHFVARLAHKIRDVLPKGQEQKANNQRSNRMDLIVWVILGGGVVVVGWWAWKKWGG
jgi:hypothetical protein